MTLTLDVVHERPRHRKLSAKDVYEMRCRSLDGASHEALAIEHHVSQSTATRAISGNTFKWVSPAAPWETDAEGSPSFGWLPYSLAQRAWEATRVVAVRVAPPKPRLTAKRVLTMLDDWEARDEADGTAHRRRAAIVAKHEVMIQSMIAGTWALD